MNAEAQHEPRLGDSSEHLGRYRLLARLGEGGMGAIHLAVTAGLGEFQKIVVLKELKPELAANREFVQLFLREVMFAGRLNHPNIVQTIEAGQVDDRYFMSMEFLDGQPFSKLISSAGEKSKIRTRFRFQVLCDVLAGLHYAHELKDYDGSPLSVVHCDVSFSNVFITYEGQVKLVDFGVARVADTVGRRTGFQGKVRYAAPEQLTGEPIDRRADIYSAGVMLWETVTLRRFTSGQNSDRAIVDARLRGPQTSIRAILPQLDDELVQICDCALSRNPEDRFATADEFRRALTDYLKKIGPRIDASEISQLLTTEFAAERAHIHGIISAKLRDPLATAASVPVPREPDHDDPTTVADLSTLIDSMSQVRSIPAPAATTAPPPRDARRRTLWLAGGAVALGLSLSVFLAMKPAPPAAELPPAGLPPQRAATAEDKPESVSPRGEPQAPPVAFPAEKEPPPVRAELPRDPPRAADSVAREPTRSRRGAEKGTATKATGDKKTAAPQQADATPPTRAPSTFGQDMAPRPKPEHTGIDSENPFK